MCEKSAGVLLHPSALPNQYPIGDLGPTAFSFVDFLSQSQQQWWQMLPIGPTGYENSPYDGPSAFAGNPLLISPESLIEQGFLRRQAVRPSIHWRPETIPYAKATRLKTQWLNLAFMQFSKTKHSQALDAFIESASFWLDDFVLFSAISTKEASSNWTTWPLPLQSRQPEALALIRREFAQEIRYHQFIQWQFTLQWDALKAYCAQNNIRLIGDIPLFVSHQSADAWAHPTLFKLDANNQPTAVAGLPPDYFSQSGQLWNVPVYNWQAMQQMQYTWWIERARTAFGRFDTVRLDHFIGFVRTYEIPAGETTGLHGQYNPGGGGSLFQALREALGSLPFIAEDLGSKTDEVDALRNTLQIPNMRVLQFELESSLNGQPIDEESQPTLSVNYTGTHDNNTTMGWYDQLPPFQRMQLDKQLSTNSRAFHWAAIRKVFESKANLAIIPMQDILGLNAKSRTNFPGTAKNNWQWRMKKNTLTPALAKKLGELTQSCGR